MWLHDYSASNSIEIRSPDRSKSSCKWFIYIRMFLQNADVLGDSASATATSAVDYKDAFSLWAAQSRLQSKIKTESAIKLMNKHCPENLNIRIAAICISNSEAMHLFFFLFFFWNSDDILRTILEHSSWPWGELLKWTLANKPYELFAEAEKKKLTATCSAQRLPYALYWTFLHIITKGKRRMWNLKFSAQKALSYLFFIQAIIAFVPRRCAKAASGHSDSFARNFARNWLFSTKFLESASLAWHANRWLDTSIFVNTKPYCNFERGKSEHFPKVMPEKRKEILSIQPMDAIYSFVHFRGCNGLYLNIYI